MVQVWEEINTVFDMLPFAAEIVPFSTGGRALVMHGGIGLTLPLALALWPSMISAPHE